MKVFLPVVLFAALLNPREVRSQVVVRGGVQISFPQVGIRFRLGGHGRHRPRPSRCRGHCQGHVRLRQVREWVPARYSYRRDSCGRWVRVLLEPGHYRLVYRRVRVFCR